MSGPTHTTGARADPARVAVLLAELDALGERGELALAYARAAAALAEGLEHPRLLRIAASGAEADGRLEEAVTLLDRAREQELFNADTLNALGLVLQKLERHEEALRAFDNVLALNVARADAHQARGVSLEALRDLAEARASYQRAVLLDPGHVPAHAGLASIEYRRGRHREAQKHAHEALRLSPDYPPAVLTLSMSLLAAGSAREAESRARPLIVDPRVLARDQARAAGILGDALDAQARYEEAFAAYSDGNARLRTLYAPEWGARESALDYTAALERYFASADAGAWATPAPEGAPPRGLLGHAFLMGFPRSGTTLLEQVLASHPAIEALEERETLLEGVSSYMRQPEDLAGLIAAPESELARVREAYWRQVRSFGARIEGRVFIDKHPLNVLKLPLITRLFPRAKVLFALRDPRDVVLSCFRRHFRMNAVMYQMLTPAGTAAVYGVNMRLAARFRPLFGHPWHVVRHERLVQEFEREVREILGFLELPWTDAVRDFAARSQQRAVATPSGPQVARGLRTEGIGHWRHYQGPMAAEFASLAHWVREFGYPDR
jgi:tetratricopeptide (TPR) repeat protein